MISAYEERASFHIGHARPLEVTALFRLKGFTEFPRALGISLSDYLRRLQKYFDAIR